MNVDELFENREKLRALVAEARLYIETNERRVAKKRAKLKELEHGLAMTQSALDGMEANRQPGAPSIFGEGCGARSLYDSSCGSRS
jgi:hypothetical protein